MEISVAHFLLWVTLWVTNGPPDDMDDVILSRMIEEAGVFL